MQKIANIQESCETVKSHYDFTRHFCEYFWTFTFKLIQQFHNFKLQFDNFLIIQNKQYLRLIVGDHRSLLVRRKMLMRIFLNIQDDMQFRKPVRHEEKCPAFCLFPSRVPELFHHFRQRWLFPRKKTKKKNHKWWLWITLHKTMGINALWTWLFSLEKAKKNPEWPIWISRHRTVMTNE